MSEISNKILTGESDGTQEDIIDDKSAEALADTSPKYFFIFLVLATISALWMSWQLKTLNNDPSITNLINAGLSATLFTFFSIFIPWFIRSLVYAVIFAIFTGLAMITFFADIFSVWIFFGTILYIGFYLVAFYKSRQTLENWLLIKFGATTVIFAKIFLTGLALFLALLYGGIYAQYNRISPDVHELLASSSVPAIAFFIPEFSLKNTVDQTLEDFTKKQLTKFKEFNALNQVDQDLNINQNISQLKNKIIDVTGQAISDDETVLSYTYALLNKFTASASEKKGLATGLALAVALTALGVIKLVFAILRWPIVICATIMYYLLRSVDIIKLTTEKRNKEIILLK